MKKTLLHAGLALLLLLAGCRLTTTDVEPALPTGRLNANSTLVYRADGAPVVANNAPGLGTLLGALFGVGLPVTAKLAADSTLSIRAIDSGNQPQGYPQHDLRLQVARFRGAGTYALVAAGSYSTYGSSYEEYYYDAGSANLVALGLNYLVVGAPNQLVVTAWDPTLRILQGTFRLRVASLANPQSPVELTEGSFDMDVN